MPYINTTTSKIISEQQKNELKTSFGKLIEIIPGKSESWLMLNFNDGSKMAFKGATSPDIAMIEVEIFGKANASDYDKLTQALCASVSEILDIQKDRIYVKYREVGHWGWNGMNF